MLYQPDTVVEASDRRYIADRHGSLRVLEYYTPEQVADRERQIQRDKEARQARMQQEMLDLIAPVVVQEGDTIEPVQSAS